MVTIAIAKRGGEAKAADDRAHRPPGACPGGCPELASPGSSDQPVENRAGRLRLKTPRQGGYPGHSRYSRTLSHKQCIQKYHMYTMRVFGVSTSVCTSEDRDSVCGSLAHTKGSPGWGWEEKSEMKSKNEIFLGFIICFVS